MFTKKNFKQLAQGLDVGPALAELRGIPEWDYLTFRQDFAGSPHAHTKCIVLRGPQDLTIEAINSTACYDYSYGSKQALPSTHALIESLTARLPIKELGRIFVVSLRAGGHITPHPDEGAYAEHYRRLHICLSSEEGNTFRCGDEGIHMLPGSAWSFNHLIEHEVHNRSSSDRVHIIIDFTLEEPSWHFPL